MLGKGFGAPDDDRDPGQEEANPKNDHSIARSSVLGGLR
jgi:hypothetical protein